MINVGDWVFIRRLNKPYIGARVQAIHDDYVLAFLPNRTRWVKRVMVLTQADVAKLRERFAHNDDQC